MKAKGQKSGEKRKKEWRGERRVTKRKKLGGGGGRGRRKRRKKGWGKVFSRFTLTSEGRVDLCTAKRRQEEEEEG